MKKCFIIAACVAALVVVASCCDDQTTYHEIHFDSRGGSRVASQLVPDGEHAILPASPHKEGTSFEGWFTAPEQGAKWNFTTDVVNSSFTLYAHWGERDLAGLRTLIADAEALDPAKYTSASWVLLATALTVAKEVSANANSNAEMINDAKALMIKAKAGLVLKS